MTNQPNEHGGAEEPPVLESARTYAATFDLFAKKRGAAFLASGALSSLSVRPFPYPPRAFAVVRDRSPLQCSLEFDPGDGWTGACGCDTGKGCAHLHAAALRLIEELSALPRAELIRAHAAPQSTEAGSDQDVGTRASRSALRSATAETYEQRTGKPPTGQALAYLRALEDCDNALAHANRPSFEAALGKLLNRDYRFKAGKLATVLWIHAGRLDGKPITHLWALVAAGMTDAGASLPRFMDGFTEPAAIEAAREETALRLATERWTRLFAGLAGQQRSVPRPLLRRRLRLRFAGKRLVWEESSTVENESFCTLTAAALTALVADPVTLTEQFDAVSAAMLACFYDDGSGDVASFTDLRDLNLRELLGRWLDHPEIQGRIVDEERRTLCLSKRRVTWRFIDQEAGADYVGLRLELDHGEVLRRPVFYIPGQPARYLCAGGLFEGTLPPVPFAEDSELDGLLVPRAALRTPEAATFALMARVNLPEGCESALKRTVLRPVFDAFVVRGETDLTGRAGTWCHVRASGVDEAGRPRAVLEPEAWNPHAASLGQSARLGEEVLDTERLGPLAAVVLAASARWEIFDYEAGRWRLTMDTPADAAAVSSLLALLPADTERRLGPELEGLAQEPIQATIEVDMAPAGEEGIDWFEVRACLRASDNDLTPEEKRQLHEARGAFVNLPRRGWRRMQVANAVEAMAGLMRLGLDLERGDSGRGTELMHALHLADEESVRVLPKDAAQRLLARAAELLAKPPADTPVGLAAALRPYQTEGFRRLAFLTSCGLGALLADDMGLGKTLQAIAWILWLRDKKEKKGNPATAIRVLVVCPKSVVDNWISETLRFAPGLSAVAVDLRAAESAVPSEESVVVANYTQLRLREEALCAEDWDAVILDEAQYIKNPDTATAAAARRLRARHRLALTGTPVENRLLDIWSLFAFVQPGLLGRRAAFERLAGSGPEAVRNLMGRLRPFVVRRTKGQVAQDLPERIEEDVVCEMEGEQEVLYRAELKQARSLLLGIGSEREFGAQRFNVLQSLTRLRQICCDPRLLKPGMQDMPSAKMAALFDLLEPILAEGHKVLLFSQFVGMLDLVSEELRVRDIPRLLLTGETKNRHELVLRFATDAKIQVFLLSLRAAGTGLNLMAASYVVLLDPWWNPAVEAQAIDRTHRIGQTSNVMAYRMIIKDSVEEKIRQLHRTKKVLAESIVDEASLETTLDLEALRQILG